LEIASGSTFNISTYTCTVGGFLDIYGNLAFSASGSPVMNVTGITHWRSGSTSSISNGQINAKNNWYFYTGADAYLDGSTVNFDGSVNQQIYTHDADSRFGHITINQTGSTSVSLILSSNSAMRVTGNMTVPNGRKFVIGSSRTLTVDGTLALSGTMEMAGSSIATIAGAVQFPSTGWLNINSASFTCSFNSGSMDLYGKLTMNAGSLFAYTNSGALIAPSFVPEITGGTLRIGKSFQRGIGGGLFQLTAGTVELVGPGNYFLDFPSPHYLYNLTINKPAAQMYMSSDLEVKNDINIQAGTFDSNYKNILIGGNWTNSGSFLPRTGRVTFNGSAAQFCSTENFNILEVNKPAELLYNVSYNNITCQVYDWTSGGIWISPGNFTANDLADQGLRGTFAIFNGEMNLYQDASQYVDFGGEITIGSNGILNIYGGLGPCYWPYYGNASLTMSNNAILDIKDNFLYVYQHPSYSFTSNITGGTIRISSGFYSDRADFTPAGGTFEFYGTNDSSVSQTAGSLCNVIINKASASKNAEAVQTSKPVYDERSGKLFSDGTRSNTINLSGNFTATGNLEIAAGSTFNIGAYTCNVGGELDIYGNLTFGSYGDPVMNVVGDTVWRSGSTENISNGQFNVAGHWYFLYGADAYLDGSTVNFNGSSHQWVYPNDNDSRFGHVTINQTGSVAVGLANSPMRVAGNMTIPSGRTLTIGSSRTLMLDGQLDLSGTLDMSGSSTATIGGEVNYPATGWLKLNNSSFTCNFNTTGTTTLYGKLTMNSGSLFSYPNATVTFAPVFVQEVTGGTLRFGKSLYAYGPGTFQLTAGTTEFVGAGTHYFGFHADNVLNTASINKPSGTLFLTSNLNAQNMAITSGTLDLSSYSCNVAGTTNIYGTLTMTNAANDFTTDYLSWNSGSNDNITAGTFHTNFWSFNEGTNAKLGTGNTAYVYNLYYPTDDDAEFGNLVAVPYSSLLMNDDRSKTLYPVRVAGDFFIEGTNWNVSISGVDLIVAGDAYINEGSTLSFYNGANLDVAGYLSILGTLNITNGTGTAGVTVLNETGWIYLQNSTYINNTAASSSLLGKLTMNDASFFDFSKTSMIIGATFVNEIAGGIIHVGGSLEAVHPGTFELWWGMVEFTDSSVSYPAVQVTNGNNLYNMTLNKPSATLRVYDSLLLKGSMLIEAGELIVETETISLEGNWTNNAYPLGFTPGTGRVIFNGQYSQSSSSEDFHILEVAKTGASWFTNHTGAAITCQVYDYTAIGIWIADGSFTAYDLADNGLYGDMIAYHNSTIDLHQDAGQFVDLNGRIFIYPTGAINIHGGADTSYWPYTGDAYIDMSGGVLDFKDMGIRLYNLHTLTTNITGGTIRTAGSFTGNRADFQPTAGTIELYGSADAIVSQNAAYSFYNLTINKAAREGENPVVLPTISRDGSLLSRNNRANTITMNTNLLVTNDLALNAGTLDLNGNQLSVQNNISVNSGGILDVDSGAVLRITNAKTLFVNNGGMLRVIGDAVSNAMITRILGTYNLNVESGGTIAAQHAIFEYMRTNGVYVKSGAIVDPTYSFHNCTFRNGIASGRLMRIENNQTISINGAVFPANTWSGTYNVYKSLNTGDVTFTNFSGDFSGSDYEYDLFGRIHWTAGTLPAPTNLVIQIVGGNIQLTWDAVGGATSYKVYSSDSPNGTFDPDLSGSFSGTTWTAPIPATKKFYRVTAVN
jgi:hypothetical protein